MKPITIDIYLLFMTFVFLIMGTGLFVYCFVERINPITRAMVVQFNPLFYLVMSFVLFCMYIPYKLKRDTLVFKIFCTMIFVIIVFVVYVFMFTLFYK